MDFSQSLAVDLYVNREKRNGRLSIHKDEKITSDSRLQLSDLEKIEEPWAKSDWWNRSLLNRDAEGQYKFSHKSILEYFLAQRAFEYPDFFRVLNFQGMNTAVIFFQEMLLGMVKNTPGSFTLFSSKTSTPLNKIQINDLQNIDSLTIKELIFPIFYLKNFNLFNLSFIVIFDKYNLPILYLIYIIFWLQPHEGRKLREQLEQFELSELRKRLELIELFERPQLLELLERLKLVELLELLELLKFRNWSEMRKILEQRKLEGLSELMDRLELIERIELRRWRKLEEWLRNKDPVTVIELNAANDFIKECQALEKALPNVKIYY
ncbi:MAG: hypothetical protein ACKV1O_28915 [Saprospiraceae bacterium]